jgi:hypothetical protein
VNSNLNLTLSKAFALRRQGTPRIGDAQGVPGNFPPGNFPLPPGGNFPPPGAFPPGGFPPGGFPPGGPGNFPGGPGGGGLPGGGPPPGGFLVVQVAADSLVVDFREVREAVDLEVPHSSHALVPRAHK